MIFAFFTLCLLFHDNNLIQISLFSSMFSFLFALFACLQNLKFNTKIKIKQLPSFYLHLFNHFLFLEMKFTPSTSVSSSTTNSSLSDNFCKSKGNAFGCLAGVLSRILCSKSLPTHPSDPIEYHKNQHLSKIEKLVVDGSATPNVVARLMGLDTMPEIDLISSQKMLNSISKSKSMGSEEFEAETEDIQGQHRRVKTSVSFRETPEFFELEDDDFFVLSFDNGGKSKKKGSNSGHNHRKRREKCGRKQRRNRDEQSKDRVFSNEERLSLKISPPKFDASVDVQKQSYHLSPLKEKMCSKKEELEGDKARKKKNKEDCLGQSKVEVDCDSDNSSPVSVLDHNTEFISDPEVTTSEEDPRLEGCECASRDITSQSNGSSKGYEKETNVNEKKNVGLRRRDYKKPENIEMLRKTCRLAEAEIKNSNWKYRRMLEADDLEFTAKDFGQGIFDQLISELVDQLVELECHEL